MNFKRLVELYEKLEATSSGNEMREILAAFFADVEKSDVRIVAYLTLGRLGAEYEHLTLGMAERTILKSIAKAGGVSEKKVRELVDTKGDAGLVAQEVLKTKPMTLVPLGELSIHDFFDTLHAISASSGSGSQEKKTNLLVKVLQKTSSKGGKYVTRIALGTMRMGVAQQTVLDSLAIAFTGEKKNKKILERAFNIKPDVGEIARVIAYGGLSGFDSFKVEVGVPIKMMLAQRVGQLEEVPSKIEGEVIVDGKYDGERVQIHKLKDGTVTLFSRRLDNITSQFPDLVAYVTEFIKVKECIIEGEILPIDATGKALAFQTLMQRRRKTKIEEYVQKIPVQLKVFDVLYVDGKDVMEEAYEKRVEIIEKIVVDNLHMKVSDKLRTANVVEMDTYFHTMLESGYEGVIIKDPQGKYQAGTRGWNWIKWKKDYVKEMADTFDLVVVGAYHGRGKRSGTYGALLCALYDENNDEFVTFCKLGTGLSDSQLGELPSLLEEHKIEKRSGRVRVAREMEPDVWFEPFVVVEVEGAEVTRSPSHTAGLALRFPRFLHYREKQAEDATTVDEVREIV